MASPMDTIRGIEPDLTVIVGSGRKQQRFRCHSVILASHSAYVEAALANFHEQETMQIRFPDVTPALWGEMISYLAPGRSNCDIKQVLPFYSKYQFRGGLYMCDCVLESLLKPTVEGYDKSSKCQDGCRRLEFDDKDVEAALLAHEYQLPRSSILAVRFAEYPVLKDPAPFFSLHENQVKALMPILYNDKEKMEKLAWDEVCGRMFPDCGGLTYQSRHRECSQRLKSMSIEQLREIVVEESYIANFLRAKRNNMMETYGIPF